MNKFWFLLFLLGIIVSCDDFLKEDPKGQLATTVFFSTEDDLDMSIHALYRQAMLTGQTDSKSTYAWGGDDITTHPASNKQSYREFDQWNVSSANSFVEETWSAFYSLIKCSNYIINNASRTPVSDDISKQAIAQAKYWRAYSYYMLVRIFGPLPILLDEEIDYEKELSRVAEVYKLIVSDLEYAETYLPDNWSGVPYESNGMNVYVNNGAAKATLAHVYLSMAGWPLKETDKYALARDKAKEVIDATDNGTYNYVLLSDYADLFKKASDLNNLELVVALCYNKDWGWDDNTMLSLVEIFDSAGGWGDLRGEIKFWKEMPDGPRKDATYAPKIYQTSSGSLVDWWECPEQNPMFMKTAEGADSGDYDYTQGAGATSWLGEKTHQIIRYSEVLLWYAEAQARADGTPNSLAYECINRVRERAGLDDLPIGLSGSDFADVVVQEHAWEVAGYYAGNIACRYFDMQRLELLKEHFEFRLENPEIEVTNGVFLNEKVAIPSISWTEDLMYSPYPSADVTLNPNLVR